MTAYEIRLKGCDEVTSFVMDLSAKEASQYSCEPTMTVTHATEGDTAP